MDNFYKILNEIGEELGINITYLSGGWVTVLEKDNQIHYIHGYKFDLNNHGIGNLMDDKGLFNDLLVYKNFPTTTQLSVFMTYDREKVLEYFKQNNNTLIVKGNLGTCGMNVYLVHDEKDLFDKMDLLLSKQDSISLEPYYDIESEYRVILLNGEVKVVYGKRKPIIVGDGIHTIRELAVNFNEFFVNNEVKNPDYIPRINEKVELDFRFNLSMGARLFYDVDEELKNRIVELATSVSKAFNISFASIDIIHTTDDKLLVLEANSGVMMDNFIKQYPNGYNYAYGIYKEAIKLMFNIK